MTFLYREVLSATLGCCQPRRPLEGFERFISSIVWPQQSTKRASVSSFRMVINGRGQAALFTAALAYNQRKEEGERERGEGEGEEPNRTTTYRARVSLKEKER